LAIELAEIKNDPCFTSLFEEFALLKLMAQRLITNLPEDLASVYGQPVCSVCKKTLKDDSYDIITPLDGRMNEKRIEQLLKVIRDMGNIFDKSSRHEERQKRFITVSELEVIVKNWATILMKYFGDDPRIAEVQEEILNSGFIRKPGDGDIERLNKIQRFQKKVQNKVINATRDRGKRISVDIALAEVLNAENCEIVSCEEVKIPSGKIKYKKTIEHDGVNDEYLY
jgi:hypothetical protein